MTTRNLLIAALLGVSGLAVHLHAPNLAAAQGATTGAIQGTVTDQKDGSALAGVTVIVTSPALAQTQTAITDENGHVQDQRPAARRLPRHVLLRRHHGRARQHPRRHRQGDAGVPEAQSGSGRRRGRRDHGDRPDDRPDVDDAGHHDRQELHQEHPGPGPHVRGRARRGRRFAERRPRRVVLGSARRSRTSTTSTASTRPA